MSRQKRLFSVLQLRYLDLSDRRRCLLLVAEVSVKAVGER
jgi:hypothetical protein